MRAHEKFPFIVTTGLSITPAFVFHISPKRIRKRSRPVKRSMSLQSNLSSAIRPRGILMRKTRAWKSAKTPSISRAKSFAFAWRIRRGQRHVLILILMNLIPVYKAFPLGVQNEGLVDIKDESASQRLYQFSVIVYPAPGRVRHIKMSLHKYVD